jgi:hypothetical protein
MRPTENSGTEIPEYNARSVRVVDIILDDDDDDSVAVVGEEMVMALVLIFATLVVMEFLERALLVVAV